MTWMVMVLLFVTGCAAARYTRSEVVDGKMTVVEKRVIFAIGSAKFEGNDVEAPVRIPNITVIK